MLDAILIAPCPVCGCMPQVTIRPVTLWFRVGCGERCAYHLWWEDPDLVMAISKWNTGVKNVNPPLPLFRWKND